MLEDPSAWMKGYTTQMEWIEGRLTVSEAQHALASRETTLEQNPFNAGGDQALRDHIERLERDDLYEEDN